MAKIRNYWTGTQCYGTGYEMMARIRELEAERDVLEKKLSEANTTYTEMHLALESLQDENKALREAAALIGVKIGHGGEIGNCQCGKCNARRDDHAEILALIDRTAEGT